MNKEQMKNVLTKVQELEKILMRDLTDEEIAYLESHSSKDFLFDILGYSEKDLRSLQSIKDILSEYCTSVHKDFDEIDDALSIFDSDGEFTPYPITKSFFSNEDSKHNDVIEKALELVKKFQEEQEKPKIKIKEAEAPDTKGFVFPQDTKENLVNAIDPKWIVNLGDPELIIRIASSVLKDFMENSSEEIKEDTSNIFYGEIVDKIKDSVIQQKVLELTQLKELEIPDEEIRSEVLDYLYKHKYKVIQQDNKIKIL